MMRADPSKQIRVAAAEACAGLGAPDEAVSVLTGLLASTETPLVRLQAVNALTRIGPPAIAASPELRAAAEEKSEYVRNAAAYLVQVLEGAYDPHKPIFDLDGLTARAARQPA